MQPPPTDNEKSLLQISDPRPPGNLGSWILDPRWIQDFRSKTPRNIWATHKSLISDPRSKIQDFRSKIQDPRFQIQDPQDFRSWIHWPHISHWFQIQDPRSKISDPRPPRFQILDSWATHKSLIYVSDCNRLQSEIIDCNRLQSKGNININYRY